MHSSFAVTAFSWIILAFPIIAQDGAAPKRLTAEEQRLRFDEVRALVAEYEKAREAFFAKRAAAPTEAEKTKLWESAENPRPEKWEPRFRAFADGFAPDPASSIALSWIVFECYGDLHRKALVDLTAGHAGSPYLSNIFSAIPWQPSKEAIDLLKLIVDQNQKTEFRGRAMYAHALVLKTILSANPKSERDEIGPKEIENLEKFYGKATAQWIKNLDHTAARLEMKTLLERVAAEFKDVPSAPGSPRSLAECAAADIRELQSLSVGQAAPEIVGKDLNDRPMKLSEHRGKVVLLVFWGFWAEPSLLWFKTARDLEERFGKDQFVFVGVNVDDDQKFYDAEAKKFPPFGRSFRDGSERKISNAWNVKGFPATFLIDHKGIIAATRLETGFKDEDITKAVRKLVIAARAEKK